MNIHCSTAPVPLHPSLNCRSTARVSSGQRVSLNDVEVVREETREGSPYWVYEHISQVSPPLLPPPPSDPPTNNQPSNGDLSPPSSST